MAKIEDNYPPFQSEDIETDRNVTINGTLTNSAVTTITDNLDLSGTLDVTGVTTLDSDATVAGDFSAAGTSDDPLIATDASADTLGFYGATPVVQASALTAEDATAVDSGDAGTDGVIEANRTRIGEIETILSDLGLTA